MHLWTISQVSINSFLMHKYCFIIDSTPLNNVYMKYFHNSNVLIQMLLNLSSATNFVSGELKQWTRWSICYLTLPTLWYIFSPIWPVHSVITAGQMIVTGSCVGWNNPSAWPAMIAVMLWSRSPSNQCWWDCARRYSVPHKYAHVFIVVVLFIMRTWRICHNNVTSRGRRLLIQ